MWCESARLEKKTKVHLLVRENNSFFNFLSSYRVHWTIRYLPIITYRTVPYCGGRGRVHGGGAGLERKPEQEIGIAPSQPFTTWYLLPHCHTGQWPLGEDFFANVFVAIIIVIVLALQSRPLSVMLNTSVLLQNTKNRCPNWKYRRYRYLSNLILTSTVYLLQ